MSNTEAPTIPVAGPAADKTVSHMLGEITWLLSQSPIYKNLFISDLEWMVMPAILLEQFRIFYGPKSPAAVALWANVSEETDARLRAGDSRLKANEWKGGNIPWLIELVTPFGAQDEILVDLSSSVFNDKPFNFHMAGTNGREVKTFDPADLKTEKPN